MASQGTDGCTSSKAFGPTLFEPKPFTRERYAAYLFAPWSRRAGRRLSLYGPLRYDLWVNLECGEAYDQIDECPPGVAIGVEAGRSREVAFAIVTRTGEHLAAHYIHDDEAQSAMPTGDAAVDLWAKNSGIVLRRWTAALIRQEPILLANRKQILRFISAPRAIHDPAVLANVEGVLHRDAATTIGAVLRTLDRCDQQMVLSALAELIVDRKCFTDIKITPFSNATRLSVYEEIEA